tara:strand:- start:868 stop:1626 length:759 start_codon:yes stop_codon:yes gene_type:complete
LRRLFSSCSQSSRSDAPRSGLALPAFNFERDPVRLTFEALLAEFKALRAEIEIIKLQLERNYTYLFAATAAVLASQAFPELVAELDERPYVYLLLAIATLWFPAQNTILSADMVLTFSYIREVIGPRIRRLSDSVDRSPALERYDIFDDLQPMHIRGVIRWEEFRGSTMYRRSARLRLLQVAWFVRVAILYAPTAILVVLFGLVRDVPNDGLSEVPTPEVVLGLIVLALMLALVAGFRTVGNIYKVSQEYAA